MFPTPEYLELVGPRFFRVIASTGPVLTISWQSSFEAAMRAAEQHETARIFDVHGMEIAFYSSRGCAAV